MNLCWATLRAGIRIPPGAGRDPRSPGWFRGRRRPHSSGRSRQSSEGSPLPSPRTEGRLPTCPPRPVARDFVPFPHRISGPRRRLFRRVASTSSAGRRRRRKSSADTTSRSVPSGFRIRTGATCGPTPGRAEDRPTPFMDRRRIASSAPPMRESRWDSTCWRVARYCCQVLLTA